MKTINWALALIVLLFSSYIAISIAYTLEIQ